MADNDAILYIHGMGGGGDSRIPGILGDYFPGLKVRTYDFRPDVAKEQIRSWIAELQPALLIGESLGANHALALHRHFPSLPIVLISPALNAPALFSILAFLTLIPGVPALLDCVYRPRPGDRQQLHFDFKTLRAWGRLSKDVLADSPAAEVYSFFGLRDHYRRSGIVSLHSWKKHFKADSYTLYDGTHFMEEEYVRGILVQKLRAILRNTREMCKFARFKNVTDKYVSD